MAQHDYNLANQSGADFRADLNNALSAIVTVNSGATAPSTTFAHQLWVDTSSNVLKIRNAANDAWVTTGVSITADNTFAGNLTGNVTGNLTGDVTGNADTATALETARTINGASFDGTANISFDTDSVSEGSSNLYYTSARFDSAFSSKSTSDLTEGTNLYYTDTRFDTRLATKDTDDLTEGTNLYFTNARVESYLDAGSSTPTFASAVINTSITGSAILDDDTFGTASATTVATSESIKAYVDSQVSTVDTLSEILANGNTTGGTDIAFGDNDKAVFNSNLNIFSTGTSSYIEEVGTGDLYLKASNLYITDRENNQFMSMIDNGTGGTLSLKHLGSTVLTTTSTGIDVTGTVTSDGLTVSDGTNGIIQVGALNTRKIAGGADYGGIRYYSDNDHILYTNNVQRLAINSGGDISFYDDTGSTQGLFWDASAENLFVGGTTTTNAQGWGRQISSINSGTNGAALTLKDSNGEYQLASYANNFYLSQGVNTRFFINSSGSVGIGTQAPSQKLSVSDGMHVTPASAFAADTSGTYTLAVGANSGGKSAIFDQTIVVEGSVGIGTDSPDAKVTAYNADTGITGLFKLWTNTANNTGADGGAIEWIGSGDKTAIGAKIAATRVEGGGKMDMRFYTGRDSDSDHEKMRILVNGKIGIGTDSPQDKLSIEGGNVSINNGSAFQVGGSVSGNTVVGRLKNESGVLTLKGDSTRDVKFGSETNGTAMFIEGTNGNIGIGTDSPNKKLHVKTDTDGDGITIQRNSTTAGTYGQLGFSPSTNDAGTPNVWIRGYRGSAYTDNYMTFGTGGNAGSESARLDASGRLGIGTTTAGTLHGASYGTTKLHVDGGTDRGQMILEGDTLASIIMSDNGATANSRVFLTQVNDGLMHFKSVNDDGTSKATIMSMTSAGNVGIGTVSPSVPSGGGLSIYNSTIPRINFKNSTTGDGSTDGLEIYINGLNALVNNREAGSLSFGTSNTTRATIDSSGNLLVGKTAANIATTGVEIDPNGILIATKNAGTVAYFNRLTTDGTILDFRKDGSTVGSLGSYLSNRLFVGSGDTNLNFHQAGDSIYPSGANGNTRDGAIDLGAGFSRFLDLHLSGTANVGEVLADTGTTNRKAKLEDDGLYISRTSDGNYVNKVIADTASNNMAIYARSNINFYLNSFLKATINDDGNLLVGTTDTSLYNNTTGEGVLIAPDHIQIARDSDTTAVFNRQGTDGQIITFNKAGATVGSIGTRAGDLSIGTNDTGINFWDASNNIIPENPSTGAARDDAINLGSSGVRFKDLHLSGTANVASVDMTGALIDSAVNRGIKFDSASMKPSNGSGGDADNHIDLGTASTRFQDIYATNGTIQTSDINEKQDIKDLSDAETRVAVAAKGLLKKYRWKSAVADKGDDARIHFGIMAQDLQQAFSTEGLDAGDYGMFISSTWTDETTGEEKTRLGVRYNELLAFIIAAI